PVSGCRDFLLAFLLPRTLAVRVRSAGCLNVVLQDKSVSKVTGSRSRNSQPTYRLFSILYLSVFLFPQHHRLFHTCDRETVH
ncbi:hypothetical protein EV363DRAFT_1108244, partial [Boletus edulis]